MFSFYHILLYYLRFLHKIYFQLQAAAEAKRREEEAAREQAEYERLKQEFSIEEEGVDVQQQDDKAKAMINAQIIAAIEEAKIIPVEHLAINLNLKTEVYFSSYGISLKSTFLESLA